MTDSTPTILDSDQPRPAVSISDVQMRMVLDVSRMLAVPRELGALLHGIAEVCCNLIGCERASIFIYDEQTGELWSKVALESPEIRISADTGIAGCAFRSNTLIHVPAPYEDARFNSEPDRKSGFVTRSLLVCPMADIDGKPLGVIEAVNKRSATFSENDAVMLRLLAEQAGVAIQRHWLQQEALKTISLRHEMNLARRAQEALIPRHPPKIAGLDVVGWSLPASTTGGDCFDIWKTPDGRLGILLADASGHGLAPALIVSQTRTLIRAMGDFEPDPHHLLSAVNARLHEDLESHQFVTAVVAFIDVDGKIDWSSAGHGPIIVRSSANASLTVLDPTAPPLGVCHPWEGEAPPAAQINPTGSLILVSDGIFESTNDKDELFSIERMLALIDTQRDATPAALSAALREAERAWRGNHDAADDQTIVIVQRK